MMEPHNAKWLYSKGYQFYAQKDYKNSVVYFEKALEVYPDYLVVRYRIAYAYIQLSGNDNPWTKDLFWKAINHLKNAHEIYKKYDNEGKEKSKDVYADICALHGKTLVNSTKYLDLSIKYLELSLSLKDDEDVHYQLAKAYYNKKDYAKSLENLPQKGKPPFYVLELKSQILADQNDIEGANNILFRLLKFRKKDYLYRRLATNYLIINNLGEAYKYAKQALDCNRKSYINWLTYGQICYARAFYQEALYCLSEARNKRQSDNNLDLPEATEIIDKINSMGLTDNNKEEWIIGSITHYNNTRGFGFITSQNGLEKFFFHISQFNKMPQPKIGDKVKFKKEETSKGLQATQISYLITPGV